MLHLSQHVAQMLRMYTAFAMPRIMRTLRALQGRLTQHFIDMSRPTRLHFGKSGSNSCGRHPFVHFIGCKQLIGEAPQTIQPTLRAAVALRGSVAEGNPPSGAEP